MTFWQFTGEANMGDIGGFGAKSTGKRASKSASRTKNLIERTSQPEELLSRYGKILAGLEGYGEGERKTLADAAAIGEQTELGGFEADVARRGLAGSGAQLVGRQAIRGGRQARVNEALTRMYSQRMQTALGEAGAGQRAAISGYSGQPAIGYPSTGAASAQLVGDLLGLYLAYGGGGGPGESPVGYGKTYA